MTRCLELTFCCHHSNSHVDGIVRIYDGLREVSDMINKLSAKKRSESIHESERKDVEYTNSRLSASIGTAVRRMYSDLPGHEPCVDCINDHYVDCGVGAGGRRQ